MKSDEENEVRWRECRAKMKSDEKLDERIKRLKNEKIKELKNVQPRMP